LSQNIFEVAGVNSGILKRKKLFGRKNVGSCLRIKIICHVYWVWLFRWFPVEVTTKLA